MYFILYDNINIIYLLRFFIRGSLQMNFSIRDFFLDSFLNDFFYLHGMNLIFIKKNIL